MPSKADLGLRIKTMRTSRDITQAELARAIGKSPSAITMYESGRREPDFETLEALADVFNVPMVAFLSDDLPEGLVPIRLIHHHAVPLIGSVAAGEPILADESVDLYIDGPAKADYALRVQGDSMNPTYLDGDVVYIRQVPDAPDGTVGVALIDDSACLKHLYHIPNGLLLTSDNPAYPPMQKTWPECDTIRILGVVVGYTRIYKEGKA